MFKSRLTGVALAGRAAEPNDKDLTADKRGMSDLSDLSDLSDRMVMMELQPASTLFSTAMPVWALHRRQAVAQRHTIAQQARPVKRSTTVAPNLLTNHIGYP